MTKIYEAYKKRAAGEPDFDFDLASLGEISLFSPPGQRQQVELSQLASMLLECKSEARPGVVICFASSMPGEGNSYVSYHTACVLAYGLHRRVAWVEANFQSPHRKLLAQGGVTFAELLQSRDEIDKLPGTGNLTLIAGGSGLQPQLAQMNHELYRKLFHRFAEAFEFTIVDCPPILQVIETAQLAAATDGLVAVVERKRLKRDVVRHGLDTLTAKKVRVLGAVLNRRVYELPKIVYDRL